MIELAGIGPLPFGASLLAQLGAEVTRIERPGGGRGVVPTPADHYRRGKAVVVLDLKDPGDVEKLLDLVERSDVLVEGFRPGVMERQGLGPDACFARNPDLIYARMTGWGQSGPLAERAGHDLNYISVTGLLHAIGAEGGPPQIPLNLIGDYGGGALYLVIGVLAALYDVRAGGGGQVIDCAMVDGVAHMMSAVHALLASGTWQDRRGVNLFDGGSPLYAVYETSDGRHVAVSAVERPFYTILAATLGVDPDLALYDDKARHRELRIVLAKAFRTRTLAEWSEIFAQSDACVTPVLNLREAALHSHMQSRATITLDHGTPRAATAPRFFRRPSPGVDHGP